MARRLPTLALALLACAPDYETEHLRITTHFDFPLCEGNFDSYERMIDEFEPQIGRSLDGPVDVDLWTAREWGAQSERLCGWNPQACYNSSTHRIYGILNQKYIGHEIVHAITRYPAIADAFFNEGAAVALTDDTKFGSSRPSLAPPSANISYLTAGHFTRWLVETRGRGRECVRAVLSVSHRDAAAAFAAHCGSSFDEAVDEYSTSAPWTYPPPFGCTFDSATSHDLDAAPLEFTAELDCASPDTTATEVGMLTNHTLRVATAGHYLFWTDATAVSLSRCITEPKLIAEPFAVSDDGIPPATVIPFRIVRGGQFGRIRLDPGDHLLGISTNTWTGTHEFTVRIEPAPPIARIP